MMELRQAGKNEAQGDVQSEKNSNTGATFSKIQTPLYWLRPFLSQAFFPYEHHYISET
jgi:hypothetical protein